MELKYYTNEKRIWTIYFNIYELIRLHFDFLNITISSFGIRFGIVVYFVGFIELAIVKSSIQVFPGSINAFGKQKICKCKHVVLLVQFVIAIGCESTVSLKLLTLYHCLQQND